MYVNMGINVSRGESAHIVREVYTRQYHTNDTGSVVERVQVIREEQVYHGTPLCKDPKTVSQKSLKISFDRKDLSGPLALTVDSVSRQNNWPPLPAVCPVGPCFYQDINVDIPLEFQKVVRMLYYLWMFHVLMLLLNMLGALSLFIAFPSEGPTFGLAILYACIFAPASYVCWFRTVYKAFRNDSSFNFMVFFVIFFFQLIVSVIWAIGIPGTGACGFLVGLWAVRKDSLDSILIGAFILLIAIGLTAIAIADFVTLTKVHRIYRSTGCSFAKAQGEFTTGVMRNDHVQGVMANAASAAVRNQFQGPASSTPTGSTTSATSPRF